MLVVFIGCSGPSSLWPMAGCLGEQTSRRKLCVATGWNKLINNKALCILTPCSSSSITPSWKLQILKIAAMVSGRYRKGYNHQHEGYYKWLTCKESWATKQQASKFDCYCGSAIETERKSPWLLLSSSIPWPFTHSRSITARYGLPGKQGNGRQLTGVIANVSQADFWGSQ